MKHVLPNIPRPSLKHMLIEGRTILELGAMGASLPILMRAPNGDGHPVMVLPGFMASDISTKPLRSFLARKGYDCRGWGLGRNLGTHIVGGQQVLSNELLDKVIELSVIHDAKVSLVGWSLGGLLAREIARIIPDCVRQVITLGSPFNGSHGSSPAVEGLFELINGNVSQSNPDVVRKMFTPPPVPNSALYSKTDGVVHWQACINHRIEAHHQAENIQVRGSHSGLGHNPQVVWIVANRLSQAEASWQPYKKDELEKIQISGKLKLV
jgi:pimeloyl-ACP methyl ester carboxylesterase